MAHLRLVCCFAAPLSIFALVLVAVIGSVAQDTAAAQSREVAAAPTVGSGADVRAVLDQYCVSCHNDTLLTAGLALDGPDVGNPGRDPDIWERVIRKLRNGTMPPASRPRPDEATYDAVAGWLETEIDRVAAETPNPGRTSTVHRLNRTEYHNAVRDLLRLEIDVTALLPGDETSDTGFDNNADVLSVSTSQLERYLSAARKISRLATGLAPVGPAFETFDVPLLLKQDDRQHEDLPLGSRGGVAVSYNFPVDGEYLFKVDLRTNWQDYILGMGTEQLLDVRIDGERRHRFTVGGGTTARAAPTTFTIAEPGDPAWENYVLTADDDLDVRLGVTAGPHVVSVSFVRSLWEPDGILQPQQAGEVLSNDESYHGLAAVDSLSIGGPYAVTGASDTPSRRRVFVCRPSDSSFVSATTCARRILSGLARRAYRRPVTDEDVATLLDFFDMGRETGETFDAGIQLALERLLVDPDFLLRIERDPDSAIPDTVYPLGDLAVASRLSFFLWNSIPDEPLLAAAEDGTLTEPVVLEQHVRRMLADPRARVLVDDFAAQWLHLRNLDEVRGDPIPFPDFDDNLVEAFGTETQLFLESTLRDDRSVLELLRADYTFVNERLARHYGMPGIYGSRFRRVSVPDLNQRGGLLGHGGLLALTSYPTRTSPVLRGKWLLDTLLGAPPPSPPPDVPALPDRGDGGRPTSVRERLEQHRSSPRCASCHAMIDPPGFALENFDGLGAWRTVDELGNPIDATSVMPNGTRIEGLAGLRAFLLERPERFVSTLTERLLAYAIGRGLDYHDQPAVRAIVDDAAASEFRWSALIVGVVKSPAFLMRTAGTPVEPNAE